MLRIYDGSQAISRRKLLTIGGLGLGGLALPQLFAARAAAAEGEAHLRDKSIIFLFQQGGPSQFETFDPKPEAPDGVRTVTGVTNTPIPGVIFGDRMKQLAELADKFTVVRSFQTNNGGHNIQPMVGPHSLETNIGAHYARVAGATRGATGMPTNMVLYNHAVDETVTKGRARGDLSATGSYGKAYTPFVPGAGGQLQSDMKLNLPQGRFFDDRRQVLSQLDRLNRKMDVTGELEALDTLQKQAYELLLSGGVANALDLTKEDPAVVEQYDTSRYVARHGWHKVNRGKRGYYDGHAKSLGKLLLLSRRLCEAGAGFVTIHASYEGVWDMHADGNNLNMMDGMEAVGRTFDHAVAAFIRDLEARGLDKKIMLICCGEMGRTPKINNRNGGGRDHWARLAPLMVYGGGTTKGQVIGQSTRDGGEPTGDNLDPTNLVSTILHTMFDIGQLRLVPSVPQEIMRLAAAPPISGLV